MEFIEKCIAYLKANLWLAIVLAAVVVILFIAIIVLITRSAKKKKKGATSSAQAGNKAITIQEYRARELQANAEARAKKAAEEKAKHEAIWKEIEAKLEAQRLAYEQEQGISETPQEPTPEPVQEPVQEPTQEPVQDVCAQSDVSCEQPAPISLKKETEEPANDVSFEQAPAPFSLEKETEAEDKRAEEERLAKEQALAQARAKAEEIAKAKAEAEAKAKAEAEQEAQAKAEQERIARAKAAAEKLAIEQEEARAKAKAERAEKEKAEKEKLAKKQAEEEAKVKAQQEAIAKAKAEQEEKAKAERIAAEKERAKAAEKAKAEFEAKAQNYAQVQAKEEIAATTATQSAELYEELKDAEIEDEVWYDENETDLAARYKGKWLICRMVTEDASEDEMFFFELHASNGEKLLSSEEYTTYAGAMRGIQTHKTNIAKDNFKITLSKKGDYIFKLLSGKNLLLCMGENYPTRARCERAIASTKRFAATAVIDENVQDHVVKVPVEDNSELPAITPNGKGKWIISMAKGANDEELFYFELFANNGEKLLSSEEYTTYIGAVNGIATHKANIEKDNFRISLTKRGDYIYKLLNGNGQLLCLGEHYKTKRLCQNAVESVKRFALNSPVLTDAKMLD